MKNIDFGKTGFKNFKNIIPLKKDLNYCEFRKINIIFGENGSGKTTLSSYLKNEYESCLVFNKHYVNENIYLQNENAFKAVKLIGGSSNIELTKRIDDLTSELVNLKVERENKLQEFELKKEEYKKECAAINKKYKSGTRIKDVDSIESAKINIEKSKIDYKKYDISKLTLFTENDKFNTMPQIYYHLSDNVKSMLLTEFVSKEFTFKDYNWMLKGLALVENNSCAFCGSNIAPEKIEEVKEFLKNETNKAKQILQSEIKKIEEIIKLQFSNVNKGHKYITGELEEVKKDILTAPVHAEFQKLKSFLEAKYIDMSITTNNFDKMNEQINKVNKLIDKYNQGTKTLEEKLLNEANKKNEIVRLLISDKLIGNSLLKKLEMETKQIVDEGQELRERIKFNGEEIQVLKSQLSSLDVFKDYFNNMTQTLNKHFYLEIQDNYYLLKSKEVNEIKLSDLSEGESFLFAFIYFYFENLLNYSDSPKLIVIDDPFSSLDSQNKYFIEGLLLTFIKENRANFNKEEDNQLFILTHHYGFYVDLASSMKKDDFHTFILKNDNGLKSLVLAETSVKEYKMLYCSIIKFSDNPTELNSIHIANAMRRCVETFCKFNFDIPGVSDAEKYWEYLIKDLYTLPESQAFLKFINGQSHGIIDTYSFENIKKFSILFKTIFETNFPAHHDAMVN